MIPLHPIMLPSVHGGVLINFLVVGLQNPKVLSWHDIIELDVWKKIKTFLYTYLFYLLSLRRMWKYK